MDYREKEIEIFANGCTIEYEFITLDNRKIRSVETIDGIPYRLIYKRNKNNVFVIDNIVKL